MDVPRRWAGPYDRRSAVLAATSGARWEPAEWAELARATGDTYSNVRDRWTGAEVEAWSAYLDARNRMAEVRKRK